MAKKTKKILIVEDDDDFLSILKTKFEIEGFDVAVAKDGEEGFGVAQGEKPDLILSDVLLPKIDGMQMAKKIKELNENVAVIFLTNLKDAGFIKSMEELKEFEYLIKSDSSISDIVSKVKSKL